MIDIEIDGRSLHVAENTTIIEAADEAGIYIPRFCYHKKLSIAANCRMCLVEVEKSGKPLPACATPVTAGMKVMTASDKAKSAQRSVMEFLLINHPLDCPICDQGGECELQDLSLGYGASVSRFTEGKRSVKDENLGSLISTEMTRCIQCTRCVRFGQEIAGIKELGALNRGEKLQISTYVEHSLVSELSGNIIDLCPVGALTSKPFRFSARAWELEQTPSIAPHDCLGSNIYLHARRQKVMRAVPRENELINETWLSDRDRYSYLGIHSEDRLLKPQIKENGQWFIVDWPTALEKVVQGIQSIIQQESAQSLGALASPNCTTEEFYLLQKLWRGLGSQNIDHRLHQTDTSDQNDAPLLPMAMDFSELEKQSCIWLVGSNLRREQPLLVNRLRKAQLAGAHIISTNVFKITLPIPQVENIIFTPDHWVEILAEVAKALNEESPSVKTIYQKLVQQLKTQASTIIIGAIAQNHPQAALIKQLCQWIAAQTQSQFIILTEGANSAGAWLAGAVPHLTSAGEVVGKQGLNAHQMFSQRLKAYLLLNLEPELDCANPLQATQALQQAQWVVALSPYKSRYLLEHAHVLLPTTSFAETAGSFINANGHWQSFNPIIPPLCQSKPAWQVLQNLGIAAKIEEFNLATHDFIADELIPVLEKFKNNSKPSTVKFPNIYKGSEPSGNTAESPKIKNDAESSSAKNITRITEWPMYWSDPLVRRSTALQSSAANDKPVIGMNHTLATDLNLQANQLVTVRQGQGEAKLAVFIDSRLPDDCVWIPGGCEETAALGDSFGKVTIHVA